MAKIKVVQIAIALSENVEYAQYLDDKGRVWYQYHEQISSDNYRYVWRQLVLPDEPTEV